MKLSKSVFWPIAIVSFVTLLIGWGCLSLLKQRPALQSSTLQSPTTMLNKTSSAAAAVLIEDSANGALMSAGSQNSQARLEITAWLAKESRAMDQLQAHPEAIEQRLQIQARSLTPNEVKKLAAIAADTQVSHNQRSLAVYLLTRYPEKFQKELIEILGRPTNLSGLARMDHVMRETLSGIEYGMNLQILQSLEALAIKDVQLANALENTAQKSDDLKIRADILVSAQAARHGQAYWTQKYENLMNSTSTQRDL